MEVTWEVAETTQDAWDYTFQVLRSESSQGPYEKISEPFEDRYIFVDSRIPGPNKWRRLYYKLLVTHKKDSDTAEIGPAFQEADPDLIADTVRRNEQTAFTQVIGRQCWVFPRRTFGTRCLNCWDATMNKKKQSNCMSCFDTSFLRGYLDPIECWVQIDPSPKDEQLQSMNKDQQVVTTARMSHFPVLKPKDILVELENKRWRVVKVTTTERLRAVLHQELVIRRIQSTDAEYKVPVNLERALKDVQASPSRMFSNPHNLDAIIDERTPNVFAIYETDPTVVTE
jgi:hypothetical protein